MPETERHLLGTVIRYGVLGGLILLVSVPVYVFAEPAWRGLVPRLACALVLGMALLDLRGALAERIRARDGSALEAALARPPVPPAAPARFTDLMADIRAARRSRRHFEESLWPRLVGLAGRPLPRPALRPGRGPGLGGLRQLFDAIEREP